MKANSILEMMMEEDCLCLDKLDKIQMLENLKFQVGIVH